MYFKYYKKSNYTKGYFLGTTGWLSGRASAFGPGRDPGVSGTSPKSVPFMEPASPSACVSASLFLCVSHE